MYNIQSNHYIGEIHIVWTNTNAATGTVIIDGLPINCNSSFDGVCCIGKSDGIHFTSGHDLYAAVIKNDNTIQLYSRDPSGSAPSVRSVADLDATGSIDLSFSYYSALIS